MSNDIILAIALKALKKGGGGGTTNYNDLNNKPTLNGTEIQGNLTSDDLGLIGDDSDLTEEQMEDLLALI